MTETPQTDALVAAGHQNLTAPLCRKLEREVAILHRYYQRELEKRDRTIQLLHQRFVNL